LLYSNENKNVLLEEDKKITDNFNNNTTSDNAAIRVGRVITCFRRRSGPRRMGFVERSLRSRTAEGWTGLGKLKLALKFHRRAPYRLTDRDRWTAGSHAAARCRRFQIPRTLYTRLRWSSPCVSPDWRFPSHHQHRALATATQCSHVLVHRARIKGGCALASVSPVSYKTVVVR